MSNNTQSIRGMHDILPAESHRWQFLENTLKQLMLSFNYDEIRMPLLEKTELFCRSIGEVTDIVEKEMYTFTDRNGDSLSLRPEATASAVRACIQHGLLKNQVQKLWYTGPMFRHERPQKGRYRQFHQLGVETFGIPGPDIDAELIQMSALLWERLNIPAVELQINSLGTPQSRAAYRDELVAYYRDHFDSLDEDSKRRLETNPLRILDSKNPDMKALNDNAPSLSDSLDQESKEHFEQLLAYLDQLEIPYKVNTRLVRGLDYYTKTVFEWVTDRLGAQATICAGGRFDGLVEQLGGPSTCAAGFAIGLERVLVLMDELDICIPEIEPHIYWITMGDAARQQSYKLSQSLMREHPAIRVDRYFGSGGFKAQFKQADRSGAAVALILGEQEVADQKVGIKFLRDEREQLEVAWLDLPQELSAILGLRGA